MRTFVKDFVAFLKEYEILAVAAGFIMGTASTDLVNSLVINILLPIAKPLLAAESWQEAVLHIGPVTLGYGAFVEELVTFLVLAFLIFIVAKKLLRMEKIK